MKEAIDATLRTIEKRTRLYRNTVVAVSAVLIVATIFSLALRSWNPLFAVVLVVPITGVFFLLDAQQMRRWRSGLLASWARQDFDLGVFCQGVSANPLIPPRTLKAMLDSLPDGGTLRRCRPDQRIELVACLERARRRHEVRTGVATAALTLALICLALAIRFRTLAAGVTVAAFVAIWAVARKL